LTNKPPLQVNIHDAKTNFSRYVARVEAGETVAIARAGKVVARLVPSNEGPKSRISILGAMRDQIVFDEATSRKLDKEIEGLFDESINRPL
jgi:prevent-host-death family protein